MSMTADRPSVFLSHSSAANPVVAYVRNRLYRAIQNETTFEVLLDVELLRGGDVWRPILHQWLGECDGAILLLSKEALASEWVRTEATILTWRKSLGSVLTLVPVRIGTTRDEIVATPAFEPLDVGDIQFEALQYGGDLTEQELASPAARAALDNAVDDLATRLLHALGKVEVDRDDLPMRRWVRDIVDALTPVSDDRVKDAARALQVDAGRRANVVNLRRMVAYRLLTATLPEVYRALEALEPRLMAERGYRYLVDQVVPVWISALAGRNLLDAYASPGANRVIAINAQREETGLHYLVRASCGQIRTGRAVTVNDVTGTTPTEELLVRYQRALWRASGLRGKYDAEQLALYLADDVDQQFVLIGPDAAAMALEDGQESVLDRLAGCYSQAVFLVLAGGTLWRDATGSPLLTCVTPELADGEEMKAGVMLTKIDKLGMLVPHGAADDHH
jgi:hypothetical protein